MKKLILFSVCASFSVISFAGDTHVHGYMRSNGTYVQGYHRTTPDNTVNNNYGTQGNQNPYTGAYGTHPQNPSQGQGQYNQGNGNGYANPYNNSYGGNSNENE